MVSPACKAFVHLCDEFRTDSFQFLLRESIICSFLWQIVLCALISTHIGFFFWYAVEMDGESKQELGPKCFLLVGFFGFLHKDGWIFETWDPWGRFIYSWSTCTIQRDLSWRLLNLVLPPFLVSISVYLQLFCNKRKVQDTFCAKRSSTHYSSSYLGFFKMFITYKMVYSHFPILTHKSWNLLQRCSVNGSCTLKLEEKKVKTGKWF